MDETVDALVLKQVDYGEADLIVTVLTKEYGKMSFRARGARRKKSRNAGKILPCMKSQFRFDLREGKTMFILKGVNSLKTYPSLHGDLAKSAGGSLVAEVADAMSMGDPAIDSVVFSLVETAWDMVEEGKDIVSVICLFLCDVMRLHGIAPQVDGCVRCGCPKVVAISAREGGFLCDACSNLEPRNTFASRRFRMFGLHYADKIMPIANGNLGDVETLAEMIHYHIGIKIKTLALFIRLFGVEKNA